MSKASLAVTVALQKQSRLIRIAIDDNEAERKISRHYWLVICLIMPKAIKIWYNRGEGMNNIIDKIEQNPIIAAIRKEQDIEAVLDTPVTTVFLLQADIFNIDALVRKVQQHGKSVFIHVDFLQGIDKDYKSIEYIVQKIKPNGIISTKSNYIQHAKQQGIFTVQRFFMVDSLSYKTTVRTVQSVKPDMIEIMPGVIPTIINRMQKEVTTPIIGGGLVINKEDIIEILKAGAVGVSTGKKELWVL